MRMISVDPGKRKLAWALWVDERLQNVGLEKYLGHDLWFTGLFYMTQEIRTHSPDFLVVELPRVYPRGRSHRPNDLVDLAAAAGACLGVCRGAFVDPRAWKGQTPKDICADRARAALAPGELEALGDTRNPDIMDAVGIGLWWYGRLHV